MALISFVADGRAKCFGNGTVVDSAFASSKILLLQFEIEQVGSSCIAVCIDVRNHTALMISLDIIVRIDNSLPRLVQNLIGNYWQLLEILL